MRLRSECVRRAVLTLSVLLASFLVSSISIAQTDPLPSWNQGTAKQSILDFVGRVTKSGGVEFVPQAQRVAVFDNGRSPSELPKAKIGWRPLNRLMPTGLPGLSTTSRSHLSPDVDMKTDWKTIFPLVLPKDSR